MDEPSLWVQVMHSKYLRNESFLEYTRKSTDSLVWRNMIRCRPLLQQGIRWKLGRGNKIRFWFDNWLDGHNLLDLLNWPRDVVSNPYATVSDFITPLRKWDVDKLSQVIPNNTIIQQIRGIDIPLSSLEDSFCWGLHSSGDFTTKSATWLAHTSEPLSHPDWQF